MKSFALVALSALAAAVLATVVSASLLDSGHPWLTVVGMFLQMSMLLTLSTAMFIVVPGLLVLALVNWVVRRTRAPITD